MGITGTQAYELRIGIRALLILASAMMVFGSCAAPSVHYTTVGFGEIPREDLVVAVFPFVNKTTYEALEGEAERRIYDLIARQKRFRLVEKARIGEILEEQKLAVTDLVNESTIIRLGELLDARYVVNGTISAARIEISAPKLIGVNYDTRVIGRVKTGARIVEVSSGKVMFSSVQSGQAVRRCWKKELNKVRGPAEDIALLAEAIGDASESLSKALFNVLPLTGYVIVVNPGGDVELDIGSDNGLNLDQEMEVYRRADCGSGGTEEVSVSRIAKIKVTFVDTIGARAKVTKLYSKKNPIIPGDMVQSLKVSESRFRWSDIF